MVKTEHLLIGAAAAFLILPKMVGAAAEGVGQGLTGNISDVLQGSIPTLDASAAVNAIIGGTRGIVNVAIPGSSMYLPAIGISPLGGVTYRPAITGPLSSTSEAEWQSVWIR